MLINGQKRDASDNTVIEVYNPATGSLIDTVPNASIADVQECLEAAEKAKKVWAATPLYQRIQAIYRFLELFEQHREEITILESSEGGKAIMTANIEFDFTKEVYAGFAEMANHLGAEALPTENQQGNEKDIIFTRHEPYGVVVCIVPFNWPIGLMAHKVAPALLMGNAVIIKPSSENPLTVVRICELLQEAGLPAGVLQAVTGKGSKSGNALVASPKVNVVSFTGSTEIGVQIAKLAADHLCRVYLELGGNDPMIVFEDADIDLAVMMAVDGRTFNVGQVCTAAKRFIVHQSLKDVFIEKLKDGLDKVMVGDPLDPQTEMGCMISKKAADEVISNIEYTVAQGAKLIYGGTCEKETFIKPAVLDNVTGDMDIARDLEVFGPVFPIISFETFEEAIRIANNTKYGLNSSIITNDIPKALKAAVALMNGSVMINGCTTFRTHEMNFGGYKMSGLGREGIPFTLEEMSQKKTIVLKDILK
jgi:succinate-semialdehyde dehydrogenase/glutarate-semialdehyde dehydrogenase